ncbi:MAG: hypothetical protein IJG87_08675 [Ruminococcus sp.]|nr:hypothetical protein [Ruminococcus sp.]
MKYQPKHYSDTDGSLPDNYDVNVPESRHSEHAHSVKDGSGVENNEDRDMRAHPSGIPVPDPGSTAEYVPMPGDNRTVIAPNGAIIRNPWSEQPEIKPDYEYTDEKEDLNLIQL